MSQWHGGKGSGRRKTQVSQEELDRAWERTFSGKDPKRFMREDTKIDMIDDNGKVLVEGKWVKGLSMPDRTEEEQESSQFFFEEGSKRSMTDEK